MEKLNFNDNWTFEDIVYNLKMLKSQYEEILASFCYFELHKKVETIKAIRDNLYSLKLKEWQKNKIWEYMNGYETIFTLESISKNQVK